LVKTTSSNVALGGSTAVRRGSVPQFCSEWAPTPLWPECWWKSGVRMIVTGLGVAAIGFAIGRLFNAAGAWSPAANRRWWLEGPPVPPWPAAKCAAPRRIRSVPGPRSSSGVRYVLR